MKNRIANSARLACVATIAFGLAGCATVPRDQSTITRRDIAATLPANIHLSSEGWPDARWWTGWHDPQLDALIEAALANGPSLEVAATRIGSAHAALARSRADAGLETALNANASRQRYSGNGLFPAPIGGAWYTEEIVRLEGRYNFDWWGRNRALITASAGEVNARKASYAQAERTLAAAVAQSYFTLQGLWARRANLEQLGAVQRDLVTDRERRIAYGLATSTDRAAAEADLAELRKEIAQLDTDVAREREALRALLGAGPAALATLQPVALPATRAALPARLGMDLLARRPDLQAARWQVEAALSRTEAARAAFYPDVNLSAALGLDSISLSHLLRAGSRTFLVQPALSLPLFDSKRLSAQLAGTRSERDELIAQYNQAVVEAVRDVAQDGAAVQGLAAQLHEQDDAGRARAAVLRDTQAKVDRGLADRHALLTARLALLQQQQGALALRQSQLVAEVALVHSLGGGYQADPKPALTNQ